MADRRPVVRAPEEAWQRLGVLLQLRRGELGYRRRPAFTRDRGINIRLVTDIENAYRPNTFLTPTLRDIAQAYQVTYDSLTGVLAGKQDTLEPAVPDVVRMPPMSRPSRVAADHSRFVGIERRLRELAVQGVTDPDGAQVFPDSAEDAQAWDGIGARMDIDDRAWLIADLQRRADGRAAAPDAGVNGRLRPGIRNARASARSGLRCNACALPRGYVSMSLSDGFSVTLTADLGEPGAGMAWGGMR